MLNSLDRSNFSAAATSVGSSVSQHYPIHAEIAKMLKDRSPIQHKEFKAVSAHYFACLLGKTPSSKMSTTETWIHKILMTIESSDKEALVKTLLGDKNPSGEGTVLKGLIDNLGVNNTLLLLVRASQLVNELSEEGYNRSQKSQEKLQENKKFIDSLLKEFLNGPQMRSVPVKLLTMNIDQEEISSSFVKQLEDIALTRTRSRQRMIAGVALAGLAVVAGLVYSLKSSIQPVVWPSTCTVAADSIGQPWYEKASKINLYDLSMMNSVKQQEIIDEFGLQATVSCMGDQVNFFDKLKQLTQNNLEFINLAHLKSYRCSNPSSDLKYALMDEEKIRNLTAKQLSRASSNEKKVILARIREIQQNSVLNDDLKIIDDKIIDDQNAGEISLFDFIRLSSAQLNKLRMYIHSSLFYFITNDQIQELDLRFLWDKTYEELFQINLVKLYTVLFSEPNPICSVDNLFREHKQFFYSLQAHLKRENINQSRLTDLSFDQSKALCIALSDKKKYSRDRSISEIQGPDDLARAIIEKQFEEGRNAPIWQKIYYLVVGSPL